MVRALLDAYNHDPDAGNLDQVLDPNIVQDRAIGPNATGIDAYKSLIRQRRMEFPDFQATVDQVITRGDLAVVRWHATGTNSGPFHGHPPTGRKVSFTGIDIARIACGKVVEAVDEIDSVGLFQQVGMTTLDQGTPVP